MKSIRKQLSVFILSVLCLGMIVMAATTYYELKDEMDELFDENIKQVAHAIAVHDLTARSNFATVRASGRKRLKGEEEFLIQIWRDEKLFYSSLPSQDFPRQKPGGVRTVLFENQKWRYYGLPHSGNWLIQVSQPIPLRHTVIWEIYFELLVPFLIQVPVIAGLIWLIIRRGFLPLAQIGKSIEARGASFLEKIPEENIPEEVFVMVRALNGLLDRLAHALMLQKQFTADAAHELRTPLTAVRLELDVLKRSAAPEERTRSIETLFRAVDRCARLVQQLLELARQEPELPQEETAPIFLPALIADIIADLMPLARGKNIDLAADEIPAIDVQGRKAAFSAMIGNIVNNAILYTQTGGKVRVSARQREDRVILTIADNGPGIAAAERSRVLDRFYRILN
jgi:two-component system OmpR family sensor kinase